MRRLLLLLLVACNAYDPNLGDRPFQCGSDEPRCPDGYQAVDVTAVRCECLRDSLDTDAGLYECEQDIQEPNNKIADAFNTGIDILKMQDTYRFAAVCPEGDSDFFKLVAPRAGTLIRADVRFDLQRDPPTVEILTADGTTVSGPPESPLPGVLVATHASQGVGTYLVKVSGEKQVNYDVTILIVVPN